MSLTGQQLLLLASEISTVQSMVLQAEAQCQQLKAAGTALYNDANLTAEFPNDGPTVKTWMTNTNTALTTLLSALSNMPPLNS